MLNSVQQYNQLNGVVSREKLNKLKDLLKIEGQNFGYIKIKDLLLNDPEASYFDLEIVNKLIEQPSTGVVNQLDYIEENDDSVGLEKAVSPNEIYQMVTDKIIENLKSNFKFEKRWSGAEAEGYAFAYNFVTKKQYTSINQHLISEEHIQQTQGEVLLKNPYFLTFKQIEKLKGRILKGAKAYKVCYYTILYKYEEVENNISFGTYDLEKFKKWFEDNKKRLKTHIDDANTFARYYSIPILKYYNVFNGADIEGIDFDLENFKGVGRIIATGKTNEEIPTAEAIINNYPDPAPTIKKQGKDAYFDRRNDLVSIPKIKFFNYSQAYYTTLFHELIHSTGVPKRLNRKMGSKFGDADYSFEELVAEIGATFLSANAGIMHYTLRNGAAYIKGWHKRLIELLEEDNKAIFKAARLAQKASEFILQVDENGVPKFLKEKNKKDENSSKKDEKSNKNTEETKSVLTNSDPESSISTLEDWDALKAPISEGTATLSYFKKAFKTLANSEDLLKKSINKKYTIKDFRKMFFPKDRKSDYVDSYYNNMLMFFTHGTITMSFTETTKEVVAKMVEAADQAYLDKIFEIINNEKKDREARKQKIKKTLENPETLKELSNFIKVKGIKALTPQQLKKYDKLFTAKYRELQDENTVKLAERKFSNNSTADISGVELEYNESKHTKTGEDIHVVSIVERVEKDVYYKLNALAKSLGGFYSRYNKNGAIAGFIFKEKEQADNFINATAEGSKPIAPKDVLKDNEKKRKAALKKLIEQSEARITAAYDKINADRKTNTHRRQRIAGGVIEDAEQEVIINKIAIYLAKGILKGKYLALRDLKAYTEVKEIYYTVRSAVYEWRRKNTDNNLHREDINVLIKEHLDFSDVSDLLQPPLLKVYKDHFREVITSAENKKGYKLMSKRLLKKGWLQVPEKKHLIYIKPNYVEDYDKVLNSNKTLSKNSTMADNLKSYKRIVNNIGLAKMPVLRQAARIVFKAYQKADVYNEKEKKANSLKKLLNKVQLQKIDGFYPTPEKLINEMFSNLRIYKNDTILEPSAGIGSIADYVKNNFPENKLSIIEYNNTLSEVLTAKGYNVVNTDFLQYNKKHDVIVMNPPFEKDQDIDHVLHAFSLLNSGGRLAAIMANNKENSSIKKRKKFNEFIENNGWFVKNPEGSFKDAFKQTGVNTITVFLEKVEAPEPKPKPAKKPVTSKPKKQKAVQAEPKANEVGQYALLGSKQKKDLFEDLSQLPKKVSAIIDKYLENEDPTYKQGVKLLEKLEKKGFTFDFGLDNVPTNLRALKAASLKGIKNSLQSKQKKDPISREFFNLLPDHKDLERFIGRVEIQKKESAVMTLSAPQGAGKTTAIFKMINAFAESGYKTLFASLEEHPNSYLFERKQHEYISDKALPYVSAPEYSKSNINSFLEDINHADVVFIDSMKKLWQYLKGFDLDNDLRKKYAGKLFVIIFQLTTDGKMRGGSDAQFDGDIISFIEKHEDFKQNYIYHNKNRYATQPIHETKFNIVSESLLKEFLPDPEDTPASRPSILNELKYTIV